MTLAGVSAEERRNSASTVGGESLGFGRVMAGRRGRAARPGQRASPGPWPGTSGHRPPPLIFGPGWRGLSRQLHPGRASPEDPGREGVALRWEKLGWLGKGC